MNMLMLRALICSGLALALAACSRPGSNDTPLPTKEPTVGRVQKGLQKADDDSAKRRAEIERVGEADESEPGKSISSGY